MPLVTRYLSHLNAKTIIGQYEAICLGTVYLKGLSNVVGVGSASSNHCVSLSNRSQVHTLVLNCNRFCVSSETVILMGHQFSISVAVLNI